MTTPVLNAETIVGKEIDHSETPRNHNRSWAHESLAVHGLGEGLRIKGIRTNEGERGTCIYCNPLAMLPPPGPLVLSVGNQKRFFFSAATLCSWFIRST